VEPFPLTTLLALRRREEEAAEADWTAALAGVRAAEARLAELGEACASARRRLDEAQSAGEPAALAAGDIATRHRFVTRRRDERNAAVAAEKAFRDGPLVAARAAEVAAREAHGEKRRAREAVEKHREAWLAETQRQAERRAEDARDDLTAAARHRRDRDS